MNSPPTREIEFKLAVPAARVAALVAELDALGPVTATRLEAHYFDTPDDRLARAGLSLRLRQEGSRWVQTVKLAGIGGNLDRAEHEVALAPVARGSTPRLDPRRHAGSVPGLALAAVLSEAGAPRLVARYGSRVRRRSCLIRVGGSVIEASLDQGHVEAGARRLPVCELELELKQGEVEALARLARRWLRGHGLWLAAESKPERARRLALGEAEPVVTRADPLQLAPPLSPDALARAVVANCIAQILPNAAALAGGSTVDEHVHQLRVGLRRLRTALRELGDLSSDWPRRTERVLGEVFQQLGVQRDQDAVLAALVPQLLAAGAPGVGWAQHSAEPLGLGAIVRAPAFQCALVDAATFALSPPHGPALGEKALRRLLRPRLRCLHAQVSRGGERFKQLAQAERHQVRKRLKRLRYLSEFAAPLFKDTRVERYLAGLHPAQDALGDYNDLLVARALAAPQAAHDADARFAVAWLRRAERRALRAARKTLRRAGRTPRFWKKGQC
jgi:inorganic triphosphatase YgiF